MEEVNNWEDLECLGMVICQKLKVNGGHLYKTTKGDAIALAFVPDIDLQRYQAHLRDAYKKGFDDGMLEANANYNAMMNSAI